MKLENLNFVPEDRIELARLSLELGLSLEDVLMRSLALNQYISARISPDIDFGMVNEREQRSYGVILVMGETQEQQIKNSFALYDHIHRRMKLEYQPCLMMRATRKYEFLDLRKYFNN